MDPGGFHGWYQLVGDGLKFLQKEDIMPAQADRRVFAAAPAVVVLSTFLVFPVIPMGPDLVVKDLDVGVFYALAVSSLSVIGVLMAGWASANKFALLGALRAAAQLIAYELPLLLAVVGVVVQAGTMNLHGIVLGQQNGSIFGFGRPRQPVHPHAVHRLRPVPGRRAGRAHPDAVRHAGRRERARRRLHGRVHGLPLPVLLHRRVRHRVRVRSACRHAVPRRLVDPRRLRRLGEHPRPVRAVRQADARRVPDVLGAVHVPAPA